MQEQDPYPDQIFKAGHLTTMEKLLFANKYIETLKQDISQLNIKIGELESEKSELQDKINNGPNNEEKLQKQIKSLEKGMAKQNQYIGEYQSGIKKDKYIKQLQDKNKYLHSEQSKMLAELVKLKYHSK